ncbi:MAG: hypothetical protein IJH39_05230 [Clostridia bacterium]|nr:hypothetical protein [Clostridia bacterium]
MYILADNHRILLGIFTSKQWLKSAIKVQQELHPGTKLYYQVVTPNEFSSVLFNFWTMHPEKLIEVEDLKN